MFCVRSRMEFIRNADKYRTVETRTNLLVPPVEEYERATEQYRSACETIIPIHDKHQRYTEILQEIVEDNKDNERYVGELEQTYNQLVMQLSSVLTSLEQALFSETPTMPDLHDREVIIQSLRDSVVTVEKGLSDRSTNVDED